MLKIKQEEKPSKRGLMKPKPIGVGPKKKAGLSKPKTVNEGTKSKPNKVKEKTIGRRTEKNKPSKTDKFYFKNKTESKVDNKKKPIVKKTLKKEENKVVDKERILGEVDLVSEVKTIKTDNTIEKENVESNAIVKSVVTPLPNIKTEPMQENVKNTINEKPQHFNREPKDIVEPTKRSLMSRLDVKKEPLKRPKILSGYPKISELRCKQLTTTDIVSDNKYAYSETYLTRKEYPTVDDYISLNSDIGTSKSKLDSAKSVPMPDSKVAESIGIIPDLDFSIGSGSGTIELSLEEVDEISLDSNVLELHEEETLELKLEEEETLELKLEDEETPIELVLEEEPIEDSLEDNTLELNIEDTLFNLEEPILEEPSLVLEPLEIMSELELDEEETPILEDIPLEELEIVEPKEELSFLGEINLEEYDEDNQVENEIEFKQLEIEDTNVIGGGMGDSLLDGIPETLNLFEPEEALEIEPENELEISIEPQVEELDEVDLVSKYHTENTLTELSEEEVPMLEKQTFGKKTNKQEYEEHLDLGLTYDIEDLKVEDLTSSINKSFLDAKKEENITETDISQLLQYGESDSLLSKSKNMDEALKYLK